MSIKDKSQKTPSAHFKAVLQALLVTFLWSTSWVLIKIGLQDIPALSFAGLRYILAFFCLLPLALQAGDLQALRQLSPGGWARLLALGLLFYALTQGAQFFSLYYLPAITVSLLLSFTSVIVALMGIVFLREKPSVLQWVGTGLYILGVLAYFFPIALPAGQGIGLLVAVICVLANAFSSLLGRYVNRRGDLSPLAVTVASMGIGAVVLLASGVAVEGIPHLTLGNWLIVLWLAVVNSALAFTLWNHTLRTLAAMEATMINNTMLFQIAVLAWIFLGERLTGPQGLGMLLAGVGKLLVQVRSTAGRSNLPDQEPSGRSATAQGR